MLMSRRPPPALASMAPRYARPRSSTLVTPPATGTAITGLPELAVCPAGDGTVVVAPPSPPPPPPPPGPAWWSRGGGGGRGRRRRGGRRAQDREQRARSSWWNRDRSPRRLARHERRDPVGAVEGDAHPAALDRRGRGSQAACAPCGALRTSPPCGKVRVVVLTAGLWTATRIGPVASRQLARPGRRCRGSRSSTGRCGRGTRRPTATGRRRGRSRCRRARAPAPAAAARGAGTRPSPTASTHRGQAPAAPTVSSTSLCGFWLAVGRLLPSGESVPSRAWRSELPMGDIDEPTEGAGPPGAPAAAAGRDLRRRRAAAARRRRCQHRRRSCAPWRPSSSEHGPRGVGCGGARSTHADQVEEGAAQLGDLRSIARRGPAPACWAGGRPSAAPRRHHGPGRHAASVVWSPPPGGAVLVYA